MSDRDTIESLATELGSALEPVASAFRSPAEFATFMERLGWDFGAVPQALESLVLPAEQIVVTMRNGEVSVEETPQLLAAVVGFFAALRSVPSQPAGSFPAGLDVAAFKNEFPSQLVDFLVADHLLKRQQGWGELLKLAGVLRLEEVPESASRFAFTRYTVAWGDLGRLLSDPALVMRNAYRWGQADFRDAMLLENAADALDGWHIDYRFAVPDPAIFDNLTAGPLDPDMVHPDALQLPFYEQPFFSDTGAAVGLQLLILPETALDRPGIAVLPYARGDFEEDIPLSDETSVEVRGNADFAGGVAILMRPGRPVEVAVGFGGGAPTASSAALSLGLVWQRPDESEIVLIGSPEGSRLRMGSLAVRVGVRLVTGGRHDLYLETEWKKAGLVIRPEPGDADSFLASLLPREGAPVDFDVTLGVSTSQGVYFAGGGGLELAVPAHVQLGPAEIVSALLSVRPVAGTVPVTLAATIKGDLGVVKAVVENIGLAATFTFPADGNGNLGPVDLKLTFRPPSGVGLAIDAGVVKGGGYLFFDEARGEYAGALELTAGFLSLKAIGLINTKLPDGQAGFSLLVIITAEFNPGFQLGYGFTLIGVGGILGLNRVLLLEPLAAGVRTGAVNNILFPRDIVANAPRILSDLRTIFPPKQGTTVIGPMAKIGWGTPTLISISLGVIIEIPGNVVILGRLRVALPTEEAAVVVLQVTFIGALEFERRRIWFFASLYESRVLFLTLDGEMGLLMDYGDQPEFVLSVGGFHPRFTAPALPFPSPARLQISIVNESFARVRAETYFAVTSNSVQMGCRAEAFFGFDAFSVEGYFSFDALLRFSPFYLIVEVSAGFSVKVLGTGVWGVHLRGSIEGPTPWRVRGSAEIEILFFSFDVDVDVTFGERRHDVLPPIAVLPQIKAEFEKLESWRATLPASGRLFVSLRELGAADALVLHPVGTLQISQRFAPLNLPLDRIGQQKPLDVNRVTVSAESASLTVRGPVREKFAAAQYRDMDDAAKLSAPSFEPLDAGIELGASGQAWKTGPLAQRNVRYEQIIIDTPPERPRKRFYEFPNGLFVHFRAGAAIYRSAASLANEKRLQPFAEKVTVGADSYTVAFQADNRASSATATFASFAEAEAHLVTIVGGDPNLADALHVIPGAEVNVEA